MVPEIALVPKTLPRSGLIGESCEMRQVRAKLDKFSTCEASVLIEGETGTGKELAARALHYLSDRRGEPFVPINCAALPEDLVVNELFGHRRGAFTGADRTEQGLIEQAGRGTILFDEVETLTLKTQAVLLRFLQDQEYRPLGSGLAKTASVRIVAATNASVIERVRDGRFREDLFYRLGVLTLQLPPLRSRREDIRQLAEHFLFRLAQRYDGTQKRLTKEAGEVLEKHDWPGNVRELENRLHRAFVLSPREQIDAEMLDIGSMPTSGGEPAVQARTVFGAFAAAKCDAVAKFERDYLCRLMRATSGNISAASRVAHKERRTMARLLRKHGIERADYFAADG